MKKLIIILFVLQATAGLCGSGKSTPVEVLSCKRDVFYFKVGKVLMGASIEVYSSNGELIFASKVVHRKALIDFYTMDSGTYTIVLTKGEEVDKFTFVKESSSPMIAKELPVVGITLAQ